MMLPSGTRLGPYEVIGAIGAGGMGEVSRAHDSRLGRDVAIKVLYEMATGRRAFAGTSQASLIAAALKEAPRPMVELQRLTSPALTRPDRDALPGEGP